MTAEQYGKFLVGVFEEWVRRDVARVYVQMFDVVLAIGTGNHPDYVSTLKLAEPRWPLNITVTCIRATISLHRNTS